MKVWLSGILVYTLYNNPEWILPVIVLPGVTGLCYVIFFYTMHLLFADMCLE